MHGGHLHVHKFRAPPRFEEHLRGRHAGKKLSQLKSSATLWCCISNRREALAKLTKEFPALDSISEKCKCIFVTSPPIQYPWGSWRAANPIWDIWAIKDIGFTLANLIRVHRGYGNCQIHFDSFLKNCWQEPLFLDITNSLLLCFRISCQNLKRWMSCVEHYCSG